MESSARQSYVSRIFHEGDFIIGKTTTHFFAISPTDMFMVIDGDYELLVVDASCKVTWVDHDTTSSQAVPEGVLIGGILTATNTLLYVARTTVDGLVSSGYYNPLNGRLG